MRLPSHRTAVLLLIVAAAFCAVIGFVWATPAQAGPSTRAQPPIAPIVDDRYPSFGNRMTGNQMAKPPRWAAAKKRAAKRAVKPRSAHRSPAARRQAPVNAYRAQADSAPLTLAEGFRREVTTAAAPFIRGRLICAVNVNAALAAKGIRGTGSALAKSFLRWGRSSHPVPGAVAVFHRGGPRSNSGHVALVAKIEGNKVWVLNPSRRGWRLMVYPKQAIAYRVAS